jgi:prepilin-type N-terminal cleavage/methylation domain-containing protein
MKRPKNDAGFSLLEVVVSLLILGMAIPALQSSLAGAVDKALLTKVNRQLRALSQFQYGQVLTGKLHEDEEDPFLDGQTGAFEDVGGYREEYAEYSWELRVEEVAVTGAANAELEEAGFADDGTGLYVRAYTDDLAERAKPGGDSSGGFAALLGGESPRPEGQYKKRITLTVRWAAASAEEDRVFTLVTLVPADDDGSQGDLQGALGADPNNPAAGAAGAAGSGNPLSPSGATGDGR